VEKTSINWQFSIATFDDRKVMALSIPLSVRPWALNRSKLFNHTQRIHGAAIYANINGADIYGIHGAPYIADYSSTMDSSWDMSCIRVKSHPQKAFSHMATKENMSFNKKNTGFF
jgi:hypothetical protein